MIIEQLLTVQPTQQVPLIPGTLYAWGANSDGQVGSLSRFSKVSSPVLVSTATATSWLNVATGVSHTLAIKADKTLWAWGNNWYGQLGQGNQTLFYSTPLQIHSDTSWQKISYGRTTLGIKTDGSLWAWGDNTYGTLGILSTDILRSASPVLVSGPTNTSWSLASSSTGSAPYCMAVTTTGRLYAWGRGYLGMLGDLAVTDKSSPVLVSGPTNASWAAISAGQFHALGATTDGRLYAWGYGLNGRLGNNSTATVSSPVLVSGPASTSWNVVAGGYEASYAIANTGELWSWGRGILGALGNSNTLDVSTPVLVSGPASTSWASVAAGTSYALAVTTTGRLYAWGSGAEGKLGNGANIDVSTPILVSGPSNTSWNLVGVQYLTSFAITTEGRLYAWGRGLGYEIGDGTAVSKSFPVLVSGPSNTSWTAIGSTTAAMGLTTDNKLYAWGNNAYSNIAEPGVSSPLQVGTSSWSAVAAGNNHSLAVDIAGRLYAWGDNSNAQLGTLSLVNRSSPVLVSGPAGVTWQQITAGYDHSLGITSQSRLYAWGLNSSGQLGILNTITRSSPILVSGPATTSWQMISAGPYSSYGITTLGRLYAWGVNGSGQLGINSIAPSRSSPILVSGPASTSWSTVTGDDGCAFAITTQGRLYAWGYGGTGELGNLGTASSLSPVLVSGPAATSWVLVGPKIAVTLGNLLYAWGPNTNGELGITTATGSVSSPVLVSGPNAIGSWIALGQGPVKYHMAIGI